jgi:hypothetical protein
LEGLEKLLYLAWIRAGKILNAPVTISPRGAQAGAAGLLQSLISDPDSNAGAYLSIRLVKLARNWCVGGSFGWVSPFPHT